MTKGTHSISPSATSSSSSSSPHSPSACNTTHTLTMTITSLVNVSSPELRSIRTCCASLFDLAPSLHSPVSDRRSGKCEDGRNSHVHDSRHLEHIPSSSRSLSPCHAALAPVLAMTVTFLANQPVLSSPSALRQLDLASRSYRSSLFNSPQIFGQV